VCPAQAVALTKNFGYSLNRRGGSLLFPEAIALNLLRTILIVLGIAAVALSAASAASRDGNFAGKLDNLYVLTLPMSDALQSPSPDDPYPNKETAIIGSRYTADGNFVPSSESLGIPRSELRSVDEQRILSESKQNGRFGGVLKQILQLSLGLDSAQSNYVCIGTVSVLEPLNEGDIDTGTAGGTIVTRALVVRDVQTFSSTLFSVSFDASTKASEATKKQPTDGSTKTADASKPKPAPTRVGRHSDCTL
jgi:hypothetical protein